MDSAMNEEANFCSQCGATVSLGAKFCSNCGCDLINSSTKITSDNKITLDKILKIEVTNTNATVEKGFEAIGKVFKRKKKTFKPVEKTWKLDLETPSPKPQEVNMITEIIRSLWEVVFFIVLAAAGVFGFFSLLFWILD